MVINIKKIGFASLTLLLAACADKSTNNNIYGWDGYEPAVYEHYQGGKSGPEQQIEELKKSIEQARAIGKAVPPGLHAQLGLLYAKTGNTDKAFQEFTTEKTLFPESAAYMDFLMKNKQGAAK